MLWLASVCFSKLSILFLIRSLSPVQLHVRVTLCFMVATGLWGLTTITAILFQCHLPRVWNILDNKCIDRNTLWNSINTVGLFLDLCLIGLPLVLVWNLRVSRRRKITIVGTFAS